MADVLMFSLLCRSKRNGSYKKIQEEMETETSRFLYLFVYMPLIGLILFKFGLKKQSCTGIFSFLAL
jgi:hypothetical protein